MLSLRPAGKAGDRGSNHVPSAWEADALPTELRPRAVDDTGASRNPHTPPVGSRADAPRRPRRRRRSGGCLCRFDTRSGRRPSGAAGAEVFEGLGTWIDIYDTALYRTPDVVAGRLAARGRAHGVGRDGERPLGDRRRRPGGARPARRRAPRARDRRRRVVPARARPPGARSSPGASDALVPDAAGRRVRRGRARHRVASQQERQAANRARARPARAPRRTKRARPPSRRSPIRRGRSSGT